MQKKYWIIFSLLLFVLADLSYSFVQYNNKPLDGDMGGIILPSDRLSKVLDDPFGLDILRTGEGHPASNRYFAHVTLRSYFLAVPAFLQHFWTPLKSIYLSNASFLWLTHLFLLLMIAKYVNLNFKRSWPFFIITLAIVSPFFQTNGYHSYMGIISSSVAYTSAYAFPIGLLLVFFFPFFKSIQNPIYKLGLFTKVTSIFLVIILAFNGPIIAPTGILVSLLLLFYFWSKYHKIKPKKDNSGLYFNQIRKNTKSLTFTLLFFIALCIFSFYIGTFNTENSVDFSLVERYQLMAKNGIPFLTQKLGWGLLIFGIVFQWLLLQKFKEDILVQKISTQGKWILIFIVFYLLLLPWGGYRSYRPGIIRFDTILPITIASVYYFTTISICLARQLSTLKHRRIHISTLIVLLVIFTLADEPDFGANHCEQKALLTLSQSNKEVQQLPSDCTIMSWDLIQYPSRSRTNALLLQKWNLNKEVVLYFQK